MENNDTQRIWSTGEKLVFRFLLPFTILFIISFSFPHRITPDLGKYTNPFFESMARWFGDHIIHLEKPYTSELISDSTGFYLNAAVLAIISIIICGIWTFIAARKKNHEVLLYWFTVLCRYYLAMQLMEYGFNKIFKLQFYLPEPNTLYTTLGNTPRDLLYWSTMGTSRGYNIFMGTVEVLAAFLLLFRQTKLAGALLSFGILINVLAINLGFDISVKLYSFFLLMLTIIILTPHYRRFAALFFIENRPSENPEVRPELFKKNRRLYFAVKSLVILLLIIDIFLPYVEAVNFNDDKFPRPVFHGAYDVNTFVLDGDTLPPLLTDSLRWKRAFVHRQGYFIIESMNSEMNDFKLRVDEMDKTLILTDYDGSIDTLNFESSGKSIEAIHGIFKGHELDVELKELDWKKLPLLQNEFHWTMESIMKE